MRKGFTLSEVLITLGIIGIVAALTIPSLVSAYQKHVVEEKLKQAYSILVNASRMAQVDPDFSYTPPKQYTAEGLYENDKYGIFKAYFVPYLQGVTEMKRAKYSWNGKTMAGEGSLASFSKGCFCLNNGMCFMMVNHGTNYFYIYVDLNGPSTPNVVGRDIFYFALHFTDNGLKIDGKVYQVYNSTTNDELLRWCGKTASGWQGGKSCTELIIRNSWKIPKDYPW